MAEVITPTWDDLRNVIRAARNALLVCTPYYSQMGLGERFAGCRAGTVRFWTRLQVADWVSGVADPVALLELLTRLEESGVAVDLRVYARLHAKAYVADRRLALITSANLSVGGFAGNLELAVRLQGTEAAEALVRIERACQQHLAPLSVAQLRGWVHQFQREAERARAGASNRLRAGIMGFVTAQRALDDLLGRPAAAPTLISTPTETEVDNFANWIEAHPQLPGSAELFNRYTNRTRLQLTGHFRQTFFGAWRFLSEYAQLRRPLSDALDDLAADDIYQFDSPHVLDAWVDHVQAHAADEGPGYDYRSLRRILPPQMGGTLTRGGGGISTLKRMLPLVARYLEQNGQ